MSKKERLFTNVLSWITFMGVFACIIIAIWVAQPNRGKWAGTAFVLFLVNLACQYELDKKESDD